MESSASNPGESPSPIPPGPAADRATADISSINPSASVMRVPGAVPPVVPTPPPVVPTPPPVVPTPEPVVPTSPPAAAPPVAAVITRGGPLIDIESHTSEFAADVAGSLSPFGDTEFPLPADRLGYRHPGPANRPALAGD